MIGLFNYLYSLIFGESEPEKEPRFSKPDGYKNLNSSQTQKK